MKRLVLIACVLAACGSKSTPSSSTSPSSSEPLSNVAATAEPAPVAGLRITGIEPAKGAADGGTYVLITGDRFMADGPRNAKVYFGSQQGTIVRFQSDNQLIVQAPGGTAGTSVDILVLFDPGGQMKLPGAFTFIDKSAAP